MRWPLISGVRGVRVVEQLEPAAVTGSQISLRAIEAGMCGTHREIDALVHGTAPAGDE